MERQRQERMQAAADAAEGVEEKAEDAPADDVPLAPEEAKEEPAPPPEGGNPS